MKKAKISDFDAKTLAIITEVASTDKKPFDVLKRDYGLQETEITSLMKMKLSAENFEAWKKKTASNKPKPKPIWKSGITSLSAWSVPPAAENPHC